MTVPHDSQPRLRTLVRGRIAAALNGGSDRLVRLGGQGKRPIVFVGAAGGGVAMYDALAGALGDTHCVFAAPLPQQQQGASVDTIAGLLARQVAEAGLSPGFVLAGWSLAGVFAHAAADRLVTRAVPVAAVVLLDSRIPNLPEGFAVASERTEAAGMIEALIARQSAVRGEAEDYRSAGRNLVHHAQAAAHYRPRAIPLPIGFVRSGTAPSADPEAWRAATACRLDVADVGCGHDVMLRPEWAQPVAEAMRCVLHRSKIHTRNPEDNQHVG